MNNCIVAKLFYLAPLYEIKHMLRYVRYERVFLWNKLETVALQPVKHCTYIIVDETASNCILWKAA